MKYSRCRIRLFRTCEIELTLGTINTVSDSQRRCGVGMHNTHMHGRVEASAV